jgi:hypothetical protein
LWRISVIIPSYPFHTAYSKHLLQAVTLCHTLDVIVLILFRLITEVTHGQLFMPFAAPGHDSS